MLQPAKQPGQSSLFPSPACAKNKFGTHDSRCSLSSAAAMSHEVLRSTWKETGLISDEMCCKCKTTANISKTQQKKNLIYISNYILKW